jgi:redox-sensing transcriptional repressor
METKIHSAGIITRLSRYLKFIVNLKDTGKRTVTSREISAHTKVNSAEVRRDLIYFELKGKRGVGFNIDDLIGSFNKILGYNGKSNIALVGAGNLGKALLNYKMLSKFGFKIENVFDNDPEVIGKSIFGRKVKDISEIKNIAYENLIDIAILAVPEDSAQRVTDLLVISGIKVIVNYTSAPIKVPRYVSVQTNDPIEKLLHTLYYLSNTSRKGYN